MNADCCNPTADRPAGTVAAKKRLARVDLHKVKVDAAYTELMARQWLATRPKLAPTLKRIFN